MPKDKDPKKKKKPMSRGQKRYMLVSDIQKYQKEYESEVSEEKGKAEKRSLWSTVGGVVGAGLAVMAAPAIIGAAAGAGLLGAAAVATGAGSLATGIGTGLIVGGGSAFGGRRGKELAESKGTFGGKAKRGKVDVDKFYTKAGEEATETFKDYDKSIDKRIKQQAIISGAFAGFQAGGGFKKIGELTKKGLGIGEKAGAGATLDPSQVLASDIGGTSDKLAYATTKGPAADMQFAGVQYPSVEVTSTAVRGAPSTYKMATPSGYSPSISYDPTFAFGPTSNKSLYSLLRENVGKHVFSSGVGAGLSLFQNPVPTIADTEDEINLPSYT